MPGHEHSHKSERITRLLKNQKVELELVKGELSIWFEGGSLGAIEGILHLVFKVLLQHTDFLAEHQNSVEDLKSRVGIHQEHINNFGCDISEKSCSSSEIAWKQAWKSELLKSEQPWKPQLSKLEQASETTSSEVARLRQDLLMKVQPIKPINEFENETAEQLAAVQEVANLAVQQAEAFSDDAVSATTKKKAAELQSAVEEEDAAAKKAAGEQLAAVERAAQKVAVQTKGAHDKVAEEKATKLAVDKVAAEKKTSEEKLAEEKAAKPAAENAASEKNAAEDKMVEEKSAKLAAEMAAAEKKTAEREPAEEKAATAGAEEDAAENKLAQKQTAKLAPESS